MSPTTTISLTDEIDRWKWVCPRGHRSWEPTNNHFWCATCARATDALAAPEFHELRNLKTEEVIERDELQLLEEPAANGGGVA